MHEAADVDYRLLTIDPLRKILPKSQYPTHARLGPDWLVFAGNWMTEWERTGNTKYRDKIITGMKALAAMPGGLTAGLDYGYDPKTGMLYALPDDRTRPNHFIWIFGGAETEYELQTLINVPEWNKAWLALCRQMGTRRRRAPVGAGRAGDRRRRPRAARLAADSWAGAAGGADGQPPGPIVDVDGPNLPRPMQELTGLTKTNGVAQSSLNIIETLGDGGEISAGRDAMNGPGINIAFCWDFEDCAPDEGLARLRASGFEGIELWPRWIDAFGIDAWAAALQSQDMRCFQLCPYFDFVHGPEGLSRQPARNWNGFCPMRATVGCTRLRAFTGPVPPNPRAVGMHQANPDAVGRCHFRAARVLRPRRSGGRRTLSGMPRRHADGRLRRRAAPAPRRRPAQFDDELADPSGRGRLADDD